MCVETMRMERIIVADARSSIAAHFGRNLRSHRTAARISQEDLGQRATLHRTEIGLLERGERLPRIDTLFKLASALGVPPGQLLVGIRPPVDDHERGLVSSSLDEAV
jgi:transcriptional regulator with XRE-family HTH domain